MVDTDPKLKGRRGVKKLKLEDFQTKKIEKNEIYHKMNPRGEPRLELGIHVIGIMWNYFGIH